MAKSLRVPESPAGAAASMPGAPEEPVLDVRDIQGNSLVGFNKDHQAFLFFQITSVPAAKRWLGGIASRVATAEEVLAFLRLFRTMRDRRGRSRASIWPRRRGRGERSVA